MIEAIVICSLAVVTGYGVWVQWKLNRDQNKINEIVFETIKTHAEIIKSHTAALQKERATKGIVPQSENFTGVNEL
jgi:hypothetical protein